MCERFLCLILVAAAAVAPAACSRAPAPPSAAPDRVVIMVFDQMRPDYIDRFNLEHFKRLRAAARHYPDAYIGHLASQTIVSHLVIPTGMAPRELPWQDDAFIDVAGVLGKPGAAYDAEDRKSTRLNSSHSQISYAVFCLKKKTQEVYERCDPAHFASFESSDQR